MVVEQILPNPLESDGPKEESLLRRTSRLVMERKPTDDVMKDAGSYLCDLRAEKTSD